jgi:hypothetical protein
MFSKQLIGIALAAILPLGGAGTAAAQAEIEALVYDWPSQSLVAQSAIRELGYTLSVVSDETFFIQFLNRQSWDLVVLQLPRDDITQKAVVVQLLEDHVAAGGRLLVNFNNLDEWPRLQKLLGLESVTSFDIPRVVLQTEPPHVIWDSTGGGLVPTSDPWPDSGDFLVPAFGSSTLGLFISGETAIVSSNDERTIVNGFDWDSMGGGALARQEIAYIMSCRADHNLSTGAGVLDIFDFLRFQDLFFQQDPRANMNFDANFDIFDFLAFQDAFVNGCQ